MWPHLLAGKIPMPSGLRKRADKIIRAAAKLNKDELTRLAASIDASVVQKLDQFQRGVGFYQNHNFTRPKPRAKIIAQNGRIKLWDYGAKSKYAPAVFIIPSLVNRAYILDLRADKSFVQFLKNHGLRPLLLDWGEPGAREKLFTMDDYFTIAAELFAAIPPAYHKRRKPIIAGYCMGGVFAAALALHNPGAYSALLAMATPWDFKSGFSDGDKIAFYLKNTLPSFAESGLIPVDVLQSMFYQIDPMLVVKKFEKLGRQKPDKAELDNFAALEDWINDGVPLAYHVMHECLDGWYVKNLTAAKKFRMGGKIIDPGKIAKPAMVVIPQNDRIVPPKSAMKLARQIPGATIFTAQTGHIGMVASNYAKSQLWPQIIHWLQKI